ncbi:peptidoglycan-binding protein [Candidatus Woesebacteria bacterium]|jgi:peptidoglycan hydrolase-like protein with peptidoglycan-binding domain|nr:peptidoglycan-binding protein [Candidatus Woesebacteria bacterium]
MDIRKNIILSLFVAVIIFGGYGIVHSQTIFTVVEGGVNPPQNSAPVATGATVYADQTSTTITLAATDADANPLTYTVTSSGLLHGTLTGSASSYTYTITATDRTNELVDSFTFTANDGKATSNTATITINIPKVPTNIIDTVVEAVKKVRRRGGGGGGSNRPTTPVVPVTPVAPVIPTTSLKTITVGSKGEEVRQLQKLLNTSGFKVATVGAGSPGNETTTFGAATRAALIRYQIAKKIPATGTYVVSVATPAPVVSTPVTPVVSTVGLKFARDLRVGASGADVKKLQQILNSKGFVIATAGVGSVGNEGTYFGPKTSAALLKFQKANGLPAVGWAGPKTRAFLNTLQ